MRSEDYRKGYGKGYTTASRNWPEHRPPYPPEPIIKQLMVALRELRDCADSELATFSEDDEFVVAFEEPISNADLAMTAVTQWLRGLDQTNDHPPQ